MPVNVRIPTPLRHLTNHQETVTTDGGTVGEVLDNLQVQFPGLKDRVCDEQGEVQRFVNVFVNDEDIRYQDEKDTALSDGDEISIIPAIAGG